MIGNNALLDTNNVIDVFKKNLIIADAVNSLTHSYINTTTLGELYVGVYRVNDTLKHLQLLLDFLKVCNLLQTDEFTAAIYGELSAKLMRKGKPIPTNNIWIASTAKQYNLTLFTKDRHFREIDGIDVQYR